MSVLSADTRQPPRVCWIDEGLSTGGVSAIGHVLLRGLQSDGWSVDRCSAALPPILPFFKAVLHCDVIVAAHNFRPAYAAWLLHLTTQRPLLVWVHGPLDEVLDHADTSHAKRAWLRWFYRRVGHLVFVSQASLDAYERFMGQFPHRQRRTVIPNAAPTFCVDVQATTTSSVVRLVYVGRLSSEKNPSLLIKTLRYLPAHYRLSIAGDGPLLPALKQAAADLVQDGRLKFLGHVDAGAAFYRQHDLTLLTSHYEGCPMAALESLAAGVPCAGVPIASLKEMLEPNAPYLLAKDASPAALAITIQEALQRSRSMVQDDIAAILRRYTSEDFLNRWQTVLYEAAQTMRSAC